MRPDWLEEVKATGIRTCLAPSFRSGTWYTANGHEVLYDWDVPAGERAMRESHYMTSVTRCYPGKTARGRGDRAPRAEEQKLCRAWLDAELSLLEPALVVPGGRAPEYIRYDTDLVRITKYFFEKNLPIASVCHGVEIPAYADCVKGRRMATVPKCKFDLEVCGGTFVDEPCVIDGNLISGRTFHDNGYYVGPWIRLLQEARDGA